ncbi:MAG: SDR family oxidoreductase [Magnetospiraceae bacterium]
MPTVMITGANRGLGLEFARQYAADGWRVIATIRKPESGAALAAVQGDIQVHLLDVANFEMIDALAAELKDVAIDVLVHNAGIMGPRGADMTEIDFGAWEQVLRVNALAPFKVITAFLPQVERGVQRKIVVLTSKMGSMADNSSGGSYIYRSSKAALNAHMRSLAIDLARRDIAVTVLHPGWVRTDMGGPRGLIDAEQSVAGMRGVIDGLTTETGGRFYNYDGQEIPW